MSPRRPGDGGQDARVGSGARAVDHPADSSSESVAEDVLLARALLSRIAEPACIPLWAYVRDVGPVEAVAGIRAGSAPQPVLDATRVRLSAADPEADLEAAERHGIRLVVPESADWPHFALSCLENTGHARAARYEGGETTHAEHGEPIPPLALWVRGPADLASLGTRAVGIVGARSATHYGEQVAAELAYALGRRAYVIVSGGAYGIDAAAHRGTLGAGAETVLVSAGGLDRAYPPSHEDLFRRIGATGLLVSESPPGSAPHRRRFLTRNRLIAALSAGSVVVEASLRSGAVNTARHADRLGRPLMIVPGPVTSLQSAGCHNLLRSEVYDTHLVTCADDVLSVVGTATDLPPDRPSGPRAPVARARQLLDRLDETARRVYDGLPARRSATIEDLAVTTGLPPDEVLRSLPSLELARLVSVGTAGGYQRARPPPGRRGDLTGQAPDRTVGR